MNLRTVLHFFVLASGILAAVRGSGQTDPRDRPLRFGRVTAGGSSVYNLADEKGKEIARLEPGAIVAVFKESASGWLEVEVPGGFKVWVFGRFLQPTEDPAVYEVSGNAVNLRPAPSSDSVTNFPLPQRLQAGDRLRWIEQLEPEKPLAETWVRVWSPPGVRAFVKSSAIEGLALGEDGQELWNAAVGALEIAPPVRGQERPQPTSEVEQRDTEARKALDEARTAMERERAKDVPDYDPIENALEAVVAKGGVVAIEARAELRTLATLREAAALKAELERERARRAEEVFAKQREVWARSRDKDPLGNTFLSRGTLERRTGAEGITRFYLRYGGEVRAELFCSSGRYDLASFVGTEVGIQGIEIDSRSGELPTFEVGRLEILAVR